MKRINTKNIEIIVVPTYRKEFSNPNHHVFSYRIIIKNYSEYPVKLLKRHWIISDSIGTRKEVKGNGVIGQQPIIMPGNSHSYESWCPFKADIGQMSGSYLMKRLTDGREFKVIIPNFTMIANYRLN